MKTSQILLKRLAIGDWMQIGLAIFFLFIIFAHKYEFHLPIGFLFDFSYLLGAFAINYWLMPRFFYQKKYLPFLVGALGICVLIFFVEEYIRRPFLCSIEPLPPPTIFYLFSDVLPIMMIFVGVKFAWDSYQKQLRLEAMENLARKSELQFLKSQIHPHFLFNNLNNLYAHALENSPKTPTIILELSALLRYMMYDAQAQFVPLEQEVKQLKSFFDLQELQIEGKGQASFEVKGDTTNKRIAPLLLIVFVENCFKHSMSSQTKDIKISVCLSINHNYLRLHCANTFSENKNTDQLAQGIGLQNVKTRLRLLYPNAHTLAINIEDNVYHVHLELLLNVSL